MYFQSCGFRWNAKRNVPAPDRIGGVLGVNNRSIVRELTEGTPTTETRYSHRKNP